MGLQTAGQRRPQPLRSVVRSRRSAAGSLAIDPPRSVHPRRKPRNASMLRWQSLISLSGQSYPGWPRAPSETGIRHRHATIAKFHVATYGPFLKLPGKQTGPRALDTGLPSSTMETGSKGRIDVRAWIGTVPRGSQRIPSPGCPMTGAHSERLIDGITERRGCGPVLASCFGHAVGNERGPGDPPPGCA